MEITAFVISIVSIALAIISTVFSIVTYRQSVIHDRKMHTLEAYNTLQEQVFDELIKYQPSEIEQIVEDVKSEEYKMLGAYCARIEHFCVGLNEKIYDIDTFYELAHGFFDSEHGLLLPRIYPVISKKSENSDIDYYSNFHKVLNDMKDKTSKKKS